MAPSGQLTSPELQSMLADGTLAGTWALDPARSQVRLTTRHTWGLRPLHGVFREISGNGMVTATGEASGVLTVAAGSIETRNAQRDKHLRSADFFDIATHPDITFTAENVRPADGCVRVTGSLTVRGNTRPASFDAIVCAADGEISMDGELRVNRADFGLIWNFIGIASMHNTIAVHAVFARA
jgi:polyisoprenoid-binding protein YceI